MKGKIVDYKDINQIKKVKGTKTLVGGCFDIIHYGHMRFLEEAKKRGEILIVALESDQFIRRSKKRQPFHSQKERAEILAAISLVDFVITLPIFKTDADYLNLAKAIRPKIIAITEGDRQIDNKKKQARAVKGRVEVVVSHLESKSTSQIIRRLLSRKGRRDSFCHSKKTP